MTKETKDLGLEWIGGIPKGYRVWNISNLFLQLKNKNKDLLEENLLSLSYGKIIKRDINSPDGLLPSNFSGYNIVEKNDIVLRMTDLQNDKNSLRTGFVTEKGIITSAYITLRQKKDLPFSLYSKYIYYQLHAFDIVKGFYGMGNGVRQNVNFNDIKKMKVILPEYQKQKGIVTVLEHELERVESITRETQHSIEELKKYKQSIITEAVTKGLDPDVDIKDSGVEWIGHTPTSWNTIKINQLFSIKKDIANQTGYDVLSVTQRGLRIRDITRNEGQMAADYSKYQIVEPNDFVMNHMDLLTGWVDKANQQGVTSPDYRVFYNKQTDLVFNNYYLYIFQACYSNKIFYGLGQGVSNFGRWRLQTDKFLNFYLPLPSIREQQEIVAYLDKKTEIIDTLIQDKENVLKELDQYRKSLIYEYVTGKKEV